MLVTKHIRLVFVQCILEKSENIFSGIGLRYCNIMKNFHSIKLFAFILLAFGIFVQCTSKPFSEKVRNQLSKEIESVNKQCPQLISETMRIDSCVLKPNNDLEYYYTSLDTVAFDSLKFEKEIVQYIKDISKNDQGMADIRSYGIETRYTYRASDGTLLYSFAIVPGKL